MAITAEPIKCMGNNDSIKQATAATATDNAIPGINFNTFIPKP